MQWEQYGIVLDGSSVLDGNDKINIVSCIYMLIKKHTPIITHTHIHAHIASRIGNNGNWNMGKGE